MIFVPNIPDVQGPSRIFLFPEYLKKKGYYIHIIYQFTFHATSSGVDGGRCW